MVWLCFPPRAALQHLLRAAGRAAAGVCLRGAAPPLAAPVPLPELRLHRGLHDRVPVRHCGALRCSAARCRALPFALAVAVWALHSGAAQRFDSTVCMASLHASLSYSCAAFQPCKHISGAAQQCVLLLLRPACLQPRLCCTDNLRLCASHRPVLALIAPWPLCTKHSWQLPHEATDMQCRPSDWLHVRLCLSSSLLPCAH